MTKSVWQELMDKHGVNKGVKDPVELDSKFKAAEKELNEHCIYLCCDNNRLGNFIISEAYERCDFDKHKLVDEVWDLLNTVSESVRILTEQGYLTNKTLDKP